MTCSLEELVRAAQAFPDNAFARLLLQADPLSGRLLAADTDRLVAAALTCGAETAAEVRQDYRDATPRQVAEALGVKVRMAEAPPGKMQLVCSLYEASRREITVHGNLLQTVRLALASADPGGPFGEVSLTNMAIAHELFHHLEEIKPAMFIRTFKVTLWQLGPLKNTSRIPALSEIGAFAFTKSLCRLPFYPALINLILLYSLKPETAVGYYNQIRCSLEVAGTISG
jgi:hypothetical protein